MQNFCRDGFPPVPFPSYILQASLVRAIIISDHTIPSLSDGCAGKTSSSLETHHSLGHCVSLFSLERARPRRKKILREDSFFRFRFQAWRSKRRDQQLIIARDWKCTAEAVGWMANSRSGSSEQIGLFCSFWNYSNCAEEWRQLVLLPVGISVQKGFSLLIFDMFSRSIYRYVCFQ